MRILSVLLVVVLVMFAYMVMKNNSAPQLGMSSGALKPLGSKPNGVSSQAINEEKLVEALPFVGDVQTTKAELLKACQLYGNCEIRSESSNYIHLVFTTGTMKYKDDVEFYLDEVNNRVEYRSESRVGYSDMGLNRDRYDAIALNYSQLKEAK